MNPIQKFYTRDELNEYNKVSEFEKNNVSKTLIITLKRSKSILTNPKKCMLHERICNFNYNRYWGLLTQKQKNNIKRNLGLCNREYIDGLGNFKLKLLSNNKALSACNGMLRRFSCRYESRLRRTHTNYLGYFCNHVSAHHHAMIIQKAFRNYIKPRKEAVRKIENKFFEAYWSPKTAMGRRHINRLYDENDEDFIEDEYIYLDPKRL